MRGKVFRQVLVDMPFSLPESPAFGLSQIKSYLAQEMPTEVETNILYLNHDFYKYFGEEIYQLVNKDFYKFYKFDDNKFLWVDDLRKSGLEVEYFGGSLGNWIFRQEAYCEIEDNAQQYFEKYYTNQSDLIQKIIRTREHLHEQLVNYLEQYRLDEYDLVGFTSRFQQQTAALSLARLIKERNPECVTIIGGPNLEPPAGAAAAGLFKNIDYILSGRRFLIGYKQLVQALIRRDRSSIMKIPGVFCKDKNSDMESIDPYEASHEDDINALLDLDYDEFFYSLEQKLGNCYKHKVVFLETSRGCSWGEKKRCSFCAIDGYNAAHRCMSSSNAVKYIQSIFDKYQDRCKYYVFVDSTLPKHYIYEVFPKLNIPENSVLLYEARADFTEEEIKLLALYHIQLLIVGIESFSTEALKLLNKGRNSFDNIRFLKYCRQYGIAVNWNILVGIPGETDKMIRDNLRISKKITHLYPPTGVWLISFQGNCDYNIHQENYEIKLVPDITSMAMVYPYLEDKLGEMTYFYKQKTQNMTRTQAVLIQKLAKTINVWKDRWYSSKIDEVPSLYFKSIDTVIDTRMERKTISLNKLEYKVLSQLNEPMSMQELFQMNPLQDMRLIEKCVEKFKENDLLFFENEVYMSLVTSHAGRVPVAPEF